MSKYLQAPPKREASHDERPKRPEFCAVSGCLTRWDAHHAKHVPGFADVVFTLDDGTLIARCADHYLAQIYKAGRGSHCDISGRQPDLNIDMVRAHWARVDEAEKAKAVRLGCSA
jgi:hypothetical protein